jgi:hypothetical protein
MLFSYPSGDRLRCYIGAGARWYGDWWSHANGLGTSHAKQRRINRDTVLYVLSLMIALLQGSRVLDMARQRARVPKSGASDVRLDLFNMRPIANFMAMNSLQDLSSTAARLMSRAQVRPPRTTNCLGSKISCPGKMEKLVRKQKPSARTPFLDGG